MSISDTYVVQYLLQGTSRPQNPILWRESAIGGAGFSARVGGAQVVLETACSRSGSYLVLRFQHAEDEFNICEPAVQGWLGRRYRTADERDLAALLQQLMRVVALQCNRRRLRALENPGEVRARVYRRLLFDQRDATAKP